MRTPPTPSALALAAALLFGCATTQQSGNAQPSGFLGDYSTLAPGGEGRALLVELDEGAPWASYDRILIDPVTVWRSEESGLAEIPEDELLQLVNHLDASLRSRLAQDYTLVEEPGPGTLRLRVAITEARGSRVVADTVSTVIPQLRLLSNLGKLASGTHAFVGRAGVEAEILDARTGARLAAAVDRRAGGKSLTGATDTWSDVKEAFDHWSEQLAARLAELRSGSR